MLFFDYSMLILIPGLIISFIAQAMVDRAYAQYSKVPTLNGVTGAQAARDIMNFNGLSGVRIQTIPGVMTDNYNPRTKVMSLSHDVAAGATVAAVGIAAHETGHALQDAANYWPIRFRNAIVPVCGFASQASWPLFLLGLVFAQASRIGLWLMDAGILLFCVSLLFYIITLPVEFNASRRAVQALSQENIIAPEQIPGVRRVLKAAAMTYVASMLMALLNLLRLLVIRGRRN